MFCARNKADGAASRAGAAASFLVAAVCAVSAPASALAAPVERADAALPTTSRQNDGFQYDEDYPTIPYSGAATHNAVARLQERLARGELRLEFKPPHGYLDSVLDALGIDPSSQTLVYSKTSLQAALIDAATPRSIYFDDDTYVAWIPGSAVLEIATMDSVLGPVFYTLANVSPTSPRFDRKTSRCLPCHDTYGMAGGGVPRFQFLSTLVDKTGAGLTLNAGVETTDRTPIADRWAGWYVSGRQGQQQHLGNILAAPGTGPKDLGRLRRGNLATVGGIVDLRKYVTDTSDIVALLVFDHQVYIDNLITHANFKSRAALARLGLAPDSSATTWSSLPADFQEGLKHLLEPLVEAMLLVGSAKFTDAIASTSGFDDWFRSQGPHDGRGRSLRALDLRKRLFRYRLSYLVYSKGFDGLPPCVLEYVYRRFADILSGRDRRSRYSDLSARERRDTFEILTATKPAFASAAAMRAAECGRGACTAYATPFKTRLEWTLVGVAGVGAIAMLGWAVARR